MKRTPLEIFLSVAIAFVLVICSVLSYELHTIYTRQADEIQAMQAQVDMVKDTAICLTEQLYGE